MDYDENNCPIVPPLSDIIKAYSNTKAKQATYAPITRTDFVRDGFNFDPDGFQPENSGPFPIVAVPSLIQNPPTTNPSASSTHNNLPQMIVPGGVALDHSNEEIINIQDALDTEVEKRKESIANPLPIAAEEWQGQPWRNVGTYKDLQSSVHCL